MDSVRAKRIARELAGHTVGGWRVGDYLGNGHAALVVAAEKSDRTAALKIIDPELVEKVGREQQIRRIVRERNLAGHGHPNLVEIFDGGECERSGHLFVTMELLDPITLGNVRDSLPRDRIGPLIGQLASAARFLEEREICHRDIKSDNVVITADFRRLKLLDLGVIRPHGDLTGGTGEKFVGTARYSPPEYILGQVDESREGWRALTVYQIGATLYDLLMRSPIYGEEKEPPARLYDAILNHTPVIRADDAERWLVDLARRCLHKDWKTRNRLVAWADFDGPPGAPSPQAVRDRLRSRMSATPNRPRQATAETVGRRSQERQASAVATIAREVCQQGETFPPVEVSSRVDGPWWVIHVRTGPSPSHDLAGLLDMVLVVEPLAAENTHVRISAAASLGAEAAVTDAVEVVYVGELANTDLRDAIDKYLHEALEQALGTGLPPPEGFSVRTSRECR